MKNLLFSAEEIKSKRYFSDVMFCRHLIPQYKLNSKYKFRKLLFLHKLIIQKVSFSKSAGTKNSQLKIENLTFWKLFFSNFHCTGKGLLQNLILFFGKFHFKLWFSMKEFATKSCLLKWAREVKNLLLSAEHIESKRFFFQMWIFHRNLISL